MGPAVYTKTSWLIPHRLGALHIMFNSRRTSLLFWQGEEEASNMPKPVAKRRHSTLQNEPRAPEGRHPRDAGVSPRARSELQNKKAGMRHAPRPH
jgi:hypothetical protein